MKIVAFPFGGGNRYSLNFLKSALGVDISYKSPELAGRGARVDEPFLESIPEIAEDVCMKYENLWDDNYILLGHCMGGLVAFELVQKLLEKALPAPSHLVVCGCSAPSRIQYNRLSETDLEEPATLLRSFGVPAQLLQNESFFEMIEASLYADISSYNKYVYHKRQPLNVPITIIREQSGYVSDNDLDAWQDETAYPLEKFPLNGPLADQVEALQSLFSKLKNN